MKARIVPNTHRPFFSMYTCSVVTAKALREIHGYDEIYFAPDLFGLYGPIEYWFDVKTSEKSENCDDYLDTYGFDTRKYSDQPFVPYATQKEILETFSDFNILKYNSRVHDLLSNKLVDTKNCVGVHYRGMGGWFHVERIPLELHVEVVKREMDKFETNSVFICTDEQNIIEQFQNFLPNADLFYHDTIKGNTNYDLPYNEYNQEQRLKLGDDVLLDSFALSKCKSVVCKSSNIVTHARMQNPDLNVVYIDKLNNMQFHYTR
jgi:hypothetical protein